MESIKDILTCQGHRQYNLPDKPWKQYQEWHENLMLHWQVDPKAVSPFLPDGVLTDTFEGQAWVSIIAFTVKKLRPRFLPPIPAVSNFHEVNFRTYVIRDGIPGIYFLSIEASKLLPALLARMFIGLPYVRSEVDRADEHYHSANEDLNLLFDAKYHVGETLAKRTALDYWLTERHALYQQIEKRLYRVDIHHKPWPLQQLNIEPVLSGYPLISTSENLKPNLVHYAKKLTVLVWGRVQI